MKKSANIVWYKSLLMPLLGVLVALSAMVQYSYAEELKPVAEVATDEDAPAEDNQDEGSGATLGAYQAIITGFQLSLDHAPVYLPALALPVLQEHEQLACEGISLENRYFKVLFRHIISPNAP